MKILALEFSSTVRSAAVLVDGNVVGIANDEFRMTKEAAPHGKNSSFDIRHSALTLVEEALRAASVSRNDIECLAVGVGPGSYTGVRSAIALAQGWQLARDVKLLSASSVRCLAARAQAKKIFGRVNVVIDAQRNEFYVAGYMITPSEWKEFDPLHLASMEEVKSRLAAREMIVGPEVDQWFGEGMVLFPDAATLGELASGRTDFIDGEKMEPIYLRETSFVKAAPPRIVS